MKNWKRAAAAFFSAYWFVYLVIAVLLAVSFATGSLPWDQFWRMMLIMGLFTMAIINDIFSRMQEHG